MLNRAFDFVKNTIWKCTHKDAAKMLIGMGALGFALSSMAQCWAIKTNEKIDKKKKNFMLAQEAADGAVNIGLFLLSTSCVWKISDKLLQLSGLAQFSKKPLKDIKFNPNSKSHIKSGCRIFTTMIASIVACNIITPLVRNVLAGKFRAYKDKQDMYADYLKLNIQKARNTSTFKTFDNIFYSQLNNPISFKSGSLRI